MIKMISFDCFGVLLEDAWLSFLGRYGNEASQNALSDLNHQSDRGIISKDNFISAVHCITGAPVAEIENAILVGHSPNDKLRSYIISLKKAVYKIGLISNVGGPIDAILPENIYSLFDTITLSYQTGCIKPDRRIFEQHCVAAAVEPENIVFIDDRQVNVDGAITAGIRGVRYDSVDQLKKQLEILGVAGL